MFLVRFREMFRRATLAQHDTAGKIYLALSNVAEFFASLFYTLALSMWRREVDCAKYEHKTERGLLLEYS